MYKVPTEEDFLSEIMRSLADKALRKHNVEYDKIVIDQYREFPFISVTVWFDVDGELLTVSINGKAIHWSQVGAEIEYISDLLDNFAICCIAGINAHKNIGERDKSNKHA